MPRNPKEPPPGVKRTTALRVVLEQPDFAGQLAAFVFDSAGHLLEQTPIQRDKVVFSSAPATLMRSRVFIAPISEQMPDRKPTLERMRSLDAYAPVLAPAHKLVDTIFVPALKLKKWLLCLCLATGQVTKSDSHLPVCGAKVHICEVDKFWRWIIELPDADVLRLRDDLIKQYEVPRLRRPPWPPEPPVLELSMRATRSEVPGRITGARNASFLRANVAALGPQPEPPDMTQVEPLALPVDVKAALLSPSTQMVRDALVANLELIRPFLCLWPYWWRYECDEIGVVETDSSGRFEKLFAYPCDGDKPDLYFWVEYPIDGVLEVVYKPPVPCSTHWDYACGTEVAIAITDPRVPACDNEPDPTGCKVQILSIGRRVSMSELHGQGASLANQGLTTAGAPFGGKLEPRVWFSRTALAAKGIRYYRWSYRRLTEGDGTPLATPGPWTPLTRTVVRHYAQQSGSQVTHVPYALGPKPVGTTANLFEIKPAALPPGGIEWSVMDEREDLASAHFETAKLGTGDTSCAKALDAAGKYELALELFKDGALVDTVDLVDWTDEGIDLEITDIPAPFGTSTVTTVSAPDFNRVKNAAGHTVAFCMVLHVDNTCCTTSLDELAGPGLEPSACGFYDITPTSTVRLGFTARHPNDFATFWFSVMKGVTEYVALASTSGRVGVAALPTLDTPAPTHMYIQVAPDHYHETFTAAELRGACTRAAFSEALHVWTMAQDGYDRLSGLDAFAHAGFALALP